MRYQKEYVYQGACSTTIIKISASAILWNQLELLALGRYIQVLVEYNMVSECVHIQPHSVH